MLGARELLKERGTATAGPDVVLANVQSGWDVAAFADPIHGVGEVIQEQLHCGGSYSKKLKKLLHSAGETPQVFGEGFF